MKSNRLTQFLSIVLGVFALWFASAPASAQEVRATLNGRVEDSAHAAVPHATVTARENASGVATSVQSDDIGNYTIPFLLPGTYTITAEAAGFKTETRTNVQLHVGDKLTVDIPLTVGAVSETVTVTAAPRCWMRAAQPVAASLTT